MTVQEALKEARTKLSQTQQGGHPVSCTPALDATVLLSHACRMPATTLMAHPEYSVDSCANLFSSFLERRLTGEPVAYITGVKEFWGMDFLVSPAVLIPRPDTEILVEHALRCIAEYEKETPHNTILDACTGSGCIAITLAKESQNCSYTAFDISTDALAIARKNAQRLIPSVSLSFIEHDLRVGLPPCDKSSDGRYTMIVSNPPYVPSEVAHKLLEDGRAEPLLALDGGSDGLDLVRTLIDHAYTTLKQGGRILLETGEYNAKDAAAHLKSSGFTGILIHPDLAGQDRVVEGVRP